MNRLAAFFTHKWTLGIIGLIAVSILIWYGADYIKFGADNHTIAYGTRAIFISAIWLIWLVWNISSWLVERKQNNALVESLQQESESISPDEERSKDELDAIAARFKEALETLKKARFKRGGSTKSLYQLPWYIIIGPPGAGKTTALLNSGLEFPLSNAREQYSLGGVGGTRNCDWWFTNDAVLIDTAGRYTTQDSHRTIDNSAWHSFISLLRKHRRRRPINGAILAISLQDLMVQTAEQRAHQAKTLRTRINELQQELGIRFPIYLTFTKCDLVAGFSEFFANLSQAEREQVWGTSFHFDQDKGLREDIDNYPQEFDNLIDRLNHRLLWRVHQERNIDRRSALHGFPARMEALSEVLSDFIKQTFSENRYDTPPLLRGVYFTSATQEGSPIDRMMASVSADFGLERDMGKAQTNTGKSFFLQRLLNDIIFPESELVGVNRKFENTLIWGRRAAFVTLALCTCATLFLWFGSLANSKLSIGEVQNHIKDYQALEATINTEPLNLDQLAKAFNALKSASTVYNKDDHPWLSNLGLYDESIDQAADQLYNKKLNNVFYPLMVRAIESDLQQYRNDDDALLKSLKAYLSVFDSAKMDPQLLTNYMGEKWQLQLSGKADLQQDLISHLSQTLAQPKPDSLTANTSLINVSQQNLRRIPVPQRLFNQLKASETGQKKVNLVDVLGAANAQDIGLSYESEASQIPLLYTKQGYKDIDFGADSDLLNKLAEDRWIYGQDSDSENFSDADRKQIAENVKKLYMAAYAKQWKDLINSVHLAPMSSTSAGIAQLEQLSDPISSPLLALVQLTAENTALTPKIEVSLDGAPSALTSAGGRTASLGMSAVNALGSQVQPTPVDSQFQDIQHLVQSSNNRPAQIQEYLASIQALKEMLIEIDNAPDSNEAAFNIAKQRFDTGGAGPIKQVRVKAQSAPTPINEWLNDLADATWSLVLRKTKLHIDQAWKDQVYASYINNFSNRYPMESANDYETPVGEFNRYFKPGGTEQSFVASYLAPFIDTRRWQVRSLEGNSVAFNQASLRQFRRADDIRRAFFAGTSSASIKFKIEPTKLDSGVRLFALELGDNRVNYSHGPRTLKNMNWVGGEAMRVRIIFEDLNETVHRKHYEGDWAWFRLLDASTIESTSNDSIKNIVFKENGRKAEFKLIANTGVNPFDRSLLLNYNCPQYL
ncbi:type VI secretion system membrane subunit TssM [Simiduia curdlanivorans]|uniref:Type VI secretion system membrane subunit TssM n=1 Tax=Simiduia curdlanivorans TaxID=1492769 RepID=A0ABV8V4F9_9GAMM|nr:type VI secretion system membrane subunit TssM [Simiduia curdlanivorans]MDN3640219.1 type VI secretion system membrane subunit TssM [Simiduia curdlanivorans]